jgi:DNA polymerase III subunit delta
MKIAPRQADAFVDRLPPHVRVILVYGPDHGLTHERAKKAAQSACPDLGDPFRVTDLKAESLYGDPGRLADEMAAMALTGGRRVIRVSDADDRLVPALQALLKAMPTGDSLLTIEAGELDNRSKLRKLADDSGDAVASVACYVEEAGELAHVIGRMLADHGFRISVEARDWLAGALVGDRSMARAEIEKLALYMQGCESIGIDDARAVIGDSAALDLDEPGLAAAAGEPDSVDRALRRLFAEGIACVAILRAAQRHFQRLHMAVAHMTHGLTPQQAVKALRPPVFFKQEQAMVMQARRWTLPMLQQALDRLLETEAECKRTHMPDETLCARALLQLALIGKRKSGGATERG